MLRMPRVGGIVAAIVAVLVLVLVLSAVHLLPQLRNPFAETTTVRSRSGNPNSQQQVYQIAQQKIQAAARQSPLLAEAQKNTEGMLTGMLTSLGFQHVTVTFGQPGLR